MNEKLTILISELLLKMADSTTTARLGFIDGRIELTDVVKTLDGVAEGVSVLSALEQAIKSGRTSLLFSDFGKDSATEVTLEQALQDVINGVRMA